MWNTKAFFCWYISYVISGSIRTFSLILHKYIAALEKFQSLPPEKQNKDSNFKWVVSVINEIATHDIESYTAKLLLLTDSLVLKPAQEVYFDDAKWAVRSSTSRISLSLLIILF